ncbi:hypothetical protein KY308_03105 [Candidatus Woesearchaeota archaeon]|nr:hypothetical protein [Candidatus Woesearchaeota archaeon]
METDNFINKFCRLNLKNVLKLRSGYFLADEELIKLKEKIKKEPEAIGVFLGKAGKSRFHPSAPLMDIISKNSDRKIFVNKKTEWLFLCGRDIFGRGIVKSNVKEVNELVLVQNESDENLGYGKIVADLSEQDKVVVKNFFDKGEFLRKERQ